MSPTLNKCVQYIRNRRQICRTLYNATIVFTPFTPMRFNYKQYVSLYDAAQTRVYYTTPLNQHLFMEEDLVLETASAAYI